MWVKTSVSTAGESIKTNRAPAGATESLTAEISAVPPELIFIMTKIPQLKLRAILGRAGGAETCRFISRLEFLPQPNNFLPCQSTNFIAGSASATAKSSSAPPTGRMRSARIAARKSWPRNFPPLLRLARVAMRHQPRIMAADIIVAAAVAAHIELNRGVGAVRRFFEPQA